MKFTYPRELAEILLERIKAHGSLRLLAQMEREGNPAAPETRAQIEKTSPVPSLEHLQLLLDVVFFASLMKEEGAPVRFSLAYVSQELAVESEWDAVHFLSPLQLSPATIGKLSPALRRGSTYVGVFPSKGQPPEIWGLIALSQSSEGRSMLPCLTIDVVDEGILVSRLGREDLLHFARGNVTMLGGPTELDGLATLQLVTKTLSSSPSDPPISPTASFLLQCGAELLEKGHGGTILVIPSGHEIHGMRGRPRYEIEQSSGGFLAKALRARTNLAREFHNLITSQAQASSAQTQFQRHSFATNRLKELARLVAGLATIDGATLLTSELGLVCFGAIIDLSPGSRSSELWVRPYDPKNVGESPRRISISDLGVGTRHRSAAYFCYVNRGAIGLVASQDGILSLFFCGTDDDAVVVIRPFHPGTGLFRG